MKVFRPASTHSQIEAFYPRILRKFPEKNRLNFPPVAFLYCSLIIVDLGIVEMGCAPNNAESMHIKLPVAWFGNWHHNDWSMVRFCVCAAGLLYMIDREVCTESFLVC